MFKEYIWVIILSFLIALTFFIILPWLFPQWIAVFISIGTILFSIPGFLGRQIYLRPRLVISSYPDLEEKTLPAEYIGSGEPPISWLYEINRISVANVGRRAAKNCKGWMWSNQGKVRVRWLLDPRENPNTTINVKDLERLDFCAYRKEGPEEYKPTQRSKPKKVPKIIASTLEGWPSPPKATSLEDLMWCEVLVTSENADPVKAKVKFEKDKIKIIAI